MEDCTFCKIVRKEIPASIIVEDSFVTAFMDINPITWGHCLVVPTSHATGLQDLDYAGVEMFRTAQSLGTALRKYNDKIQGITLYLADGKAAGQEVMHVHLHVIPRFENDGFRMRRPPKIEYGPHALEVDAELIRKNLSLY